MTLVERLRHRDRIVHPNSRETFDLVKEAADEIERLEHDKRRSDKRAFAAENELRNIRKRNTEFEGALKTIAFDRDYGMLHGAISCRAIAKQALAGELVLPIEGYKITITNQNEEGGPVILEQDLKLSKVGGAHITNAEDLIMMIEDAVFNWEND